MIIRRAETKDISELSKFIEKLNSKQKNHIGFCGDDSQEIANSLIEDFSDITFENSFIIALENNQIVGAIGFDADLENNSIEIWGPFIEKDFWNLIYELWKRMIVLLPKEINTLEMFINNKNKDCLKLANQLDFKKVTEEFIMEFGRENIINSVEILLEEINKKDYEVVKRIHDSNFPEAYYNGEKIISRISDNRKIFIHRESDKVVGYIYVEANPKFGESSIEFFAVEDSYRKKGIGSRLLKQALKWLFSFDSIDSTIICVNSKKIDAIKLYRNTGFNDKYQLSSFVKKYKKKL